VERCLGYTPAPNKKKLRVREEKHFVSKNKLKISPKIAFIVLMTFYTSFLGLGWAELHRIAIGFQIDKYQSKLLILN
jgi:hypothetical protein